MAFLLALIEIIVIDLVLSGDNAVVIAMAIQNLPPEQAKRAAIAGGLGAVLLRIGFTALAAELLGIPLLQAIGGVVLFGIAYQLLMAEEAAEAGKPAYTFRAAVVSIVTADLVMSLDNILAIGGASHGNLLLLLLGLAISIPLVLWGSTILADWMRRYSILVYLGAAVIAWTAGSMIVGDPWVAQRLVALPWVSLVVPLLGALGVLGLGYWRRPKKSTGAS
ncbi:MAG TPA: TerC family protein [Oscillatoriaceae cyanobacterium]